MGRFDWLDLPFDPAKLSRLAREGVRYARSLRAHPGWSAADLARARVAGWTDERTVRRRIARARLEITRPARVCRHCGGPIPPASKATALHCSNGCKQAAYRRRQGEVPGDGPPQR